METTLVSEFRKLHEKPQILRLPNAWDVGSARLFESIGALAIATTSAGVSWAAGYADGSNMPTSLVVGFAETLGRTLKVPFTVDIEDGYSDSPVSVAELALRLADAGVAGINIEDGKKPVEILQRKIAAIRDYLARNNVDVFINARTDVFLARLVKESDLLGEAIAREKRYAEVGADGIFVPGLVDKSQVAEMAAAGSLPLNVLAWKNLPNAAELQQLGVKRLSAGSSIALAMWGIAERTARQFLETGDSDKITDQLPFSAMQSLFGS